MDRSTVVPAAVGIVLRRATATAARAGIVDVSLWRTTPVVSDRGLRLATWRLSGDITATEDFRRHLLTYPLQEIDAIHSLHMNRHGETGFVGVWKGVRIPYREM